jgi:thermostable 8-oxoguanine DNA glycosylase
VRVCRTETLRKAVSVCIEKRFVVLFEYTVVLETDCDAELFSVIGICVLAAAELSSVNCCQYFANSRRQLLQCSVKRDKAHLSAFHLKQSEVNI